MPDDMGLVERLRAKRTRVSGASGSSDGFATDPDCLEAAAEIERLVAEVAAADLRTGAASKVALELTAERDEAREALKPFAEFGDAWTKQSENDTSPFALAQDDQMLHIGASLISFTVGDFRRARQALEDSKP